MTARSFSDARLSVIGTLVDDELARIHDIVGDARVVDGREQLDAVLGDWLAGARSVLPRTLDLIGHSTPRDGLLALGSFVIDSASAKTTAFFRELADQEVLPRLGVTAVRLLGCNTASSGRARRTVRALAQLLGVEVYGTTGLVFSVHYERNGFRDDAAHLLVGASEIEHTTCESGEANVHPERWVLDIDRLPASPLSTHAPAWPRQVISTDLAREVLRLVRRGEGAAMPGLLTAPTCELALPSTKRGWYHRLQVLLDGDFVRVYPDDRTTGIVFAVEDRSALRGLISACLVR